MKKWNVIIPYYASLYVEVEADTKEEAIEQALQEAYPGLCYQCSDSGIEIHDMNETAPVEVMEIKGDEK